MLIDSLMLKTFLKEEEQHEYQTNQYNKNQQYWRSEVFVKVCEVLVYIFTTWDTDDEIKTFSIGAGSQSVSVCQLFGGHHV